MVNSWTHFFDSGDLQVLDEGDVLHMSPTTRTAYSTYCHYTLTYTESRKIEIVDIVSSTGAGLWVKRKNDETNNKNNNNQE